MEKTGCKIIFGAPTTLAVKGLMMMMMTQYSEGEQRCSEPLVVCLGDTEDSQKEESCNNQDVKEQMQRQESLWQLWTEDDGWN